jgi:hypothetical protein
MVKNQFKENEMGETIKWVRYTLAFKLEAVRQTGAVQNTVRITTMAKLPPARLSTGSFWETICFVCASKLLEIFTPSKNADH